MVCRFCKWQLLRSITRRAMVDLWADCARFQPDFPYIRPKLTGPWAPSTWVQLPYIAVEKSGSSVHTFYCGSKLLTVAVLWPVFGVCVLCVNKTASLGTFMATFRSWQNAPSTRTANPGSFMAIFGVYNKVAIKLLTMSVLWPQHSKLSFHHKNANPGSFMATFRSLQKVAKKLQTLAILWPQGSARPDLDQQDRDWKCLSLNNETETKKVWVSMTRPRLKMSKSQ